MKTYRKQDGVALVVTLVLLVVALLLGLSSMQTSRSEESMAGNQRASSLAYMAAEFGASKVWSGYFENESGKIQYRNPASGQGDSDFEDEVTTGGGWLEVDGASENSVGSDVRYRVDIGDSSTTGASSLDIPLIVRGAVFSGDGEVAVFREILINAILDGKGFRNLSPYNLISPAGSVDAPESQTTFEGELVDGVRNPAISAGSFDDAFAIVKDILKLPDSHTLSDSHDKYVFVPDEDGSGDGVFYPRPNDRGVCNSGNNRLCNYHGGISTKPADPIFSDAGKFHEFMSYIFAEAQRSGGEVDVVNSLISGNGSGFSGITLVSSVGEDGEIRFMDGESYQPTKVPEYGSDLDEADQPVVEGYNPPERDVFSGRIAGEGVLVVNGNVSLNGVQEFAGLVIVLGDYLVDGGGGADYEGAVVISPYSCIEYSGGIGAGCDFDPVDADIAGGGKNQYLHDRYKLDDAWSLLEKIPGVTEAWFEINTTDPYTFTAAGWVEKIDIDWSKL